MKALSIRQPWAWAILYAGKDIENRDWRCRLRGRVLVHASQGMTFNEYDGALNFMHGVSETHPFPRGLTLPRAAALTRGALVGSVEIVDCVSQSASPWFMGTIGFVLRNPVAFKQPVPFKGSLGFFDVPDSVVAGAS